jgi:hypothetical protein
MAAYSRPFVIRAEGVLYPALGRLKGIKSLSATTYSALAPTGYPEVADKVNFL